MCSPTTVYFWLILWLKIKLKNLNFINELQLSSWSNVTLVDWTKTTSNYQRDRCVPVEFLVLHHTVTTSAAETLYILNDHGLSVQYIAEKNGTMYQMVHDYYRAWHAGPSHWGETSDMNSHSVGCEIVNTGSEPFPRAQVLQ